MLGIEKKMLNIGIDAVGIKFGSV